MSHPLDLEFMKCKCVAAPIVRNINPLYTHMSLGAIEFGVFCSQCGTVLQKLWGVQLLGRDDILERFKEYFKKHPEEALEL